MMKLLFICTHNRCRSILAEAIANHLSNGELIAASAGSSPQGAVHPATLKYLREHGIAIDGLKSQSWDEFSTFEPDAVITLCDSAAKEACPLWIDQSLQVYWGLPDPSSSTLDEPNQSAAFSYTIDLISRRIERLLLSAKSELPRNELRAELQAIAREIN